MSATFIPMRPANSLGHGQGFTPCRSRRRWRRRARPRRARMDSLAASPGARPPAGRIARRPTVSCRSQGEVVSGIRIQCSCGQVIELNCVYLTSGIADCRLQIADWKRAKTAACPDDGGAAAHSADLISRRASILPAPHKPNGPDSPQERCMVKGRMVTTEVGRASWPNWSSRFRRETRCCSRQSNHPVTKLVGCLRNRPCCAAFLRKYAP